MSEVWRPSRELLAILDAREMERNRNYAAEFFRASGASETGAIDWPGFAVWLREQHTEAADLMAATIESDLRVSS